MSEFRAVEFKEWFLLLQFNYLTTTRNRGPRSALGVLQEYQIAQGIERLDFTNTQAPSVDFFHAFSAGILSKENRSEPSEVMR